MNNNPIGILDSGVGGLSVWKEIAGYLSNESTIYIADSLNCPYGSKSNEQIYQLSKRLTQFLIDKKVKIIVIACNTITVLCLNKLRKDYPKIPIVGTVPVVKTASERSKSKKIGILSTENTAQSEYQKNLIKKFASDCNVVNIGTDKLVPLIEKGKIDNKVFDNLLKEELRYFRESGIDILALGCTHFTFLRSKIERIMGKEIVVLDSGSAIARQVKRVLEANNALSSGSFSHVFYTTGNIETFHQVAKKLLGKEDMKMVKSMERISI